MIDSAPLDEMVDGAGGFRPHWRGLLGALSSLGRGELAERARLLDQHFLEEGATSLLPGGSNTPAWRCDPFPLILPPAEFDALAAGLAQRASLLEAVLHDVYGPQTLLAEGLLPPALVYANPAFLRSCRDAAAHRQGPLLHLYAADLLRAPDGQWRVLADRTAGARPASRMCWRTAALCRAMCRNCSRRATSGGTAPSSTSGRMPCSAWRRRRPTAATPASPCSPPGHSSPHWYEHVMLSRRLSCALVEGGDLTVRDGALFLKTLRGLQPVDVLLRRVDGRQMDPLEGDQSPAHGVAGLLDAVRGGTVRIVNDPGAGFAEAPALAAFLPALAQRLLGEDAAACRRPHPLARRPGGAGHGRRRSRPLDGAARGGRHGAVHHRRRPAGCGAGRAGRSGSWRHPRNMPSPPACRPRSRPVRDRTGWSRGR